MHYITFFIIILIVIFIVISFSSIVVDDITKFYPLFATSSSIIGLFILLRKEYKEDKKENIKNRNDIYDKIYNKQSPNRSNKNAKTITKPSYYENKLDAFHKTGDNSPGGLLNTGPFRYEDFHKDSDYVNYREYETRMKNYYEDDPVIKELNRTMPYYGLPGFEYKTIDDNMYERRRIRDVSNRNAKHNYINKNKDDFYKLVFGNTFTNNEKLNWWEVD